MLERPVVVSNDSLPYSYISELQHQRFGEKIFNPQQDKDATEKLLALREEWQKQDIITGFSSGVFDLLHMDHMAYLLHVKASTAALLYEKNHKKPWNELKPEQQQDYTSKALGQRAIRLIISIDGDESVLARKGNNPEKRGIPTPIYGWETRAMMVASLAFTDPSNKSSNELIPTVDAVTIHGPQDFSADNPHSSHFDLVSILKPDVWTVFGESKDILEGAPLRPSLASVALRCIQDGAGIHYYEDKYIGKLSTTKIAKRIIGV